MNSNEQIGGVYIKPEVVKIAYDGGIAEDETTSAILAHFIKHSTIYPLGSFGSSLYGCNVRCILNEKKESPYLSTEIDTFGEEIREIIIKFSLHHDKRDEEEEEEYKRFNGIDKGISHISGFINEVGLQQSIFAKSSESGYSICPGTCLAVLLDKGSFDSRRINSNSVDLIRKNIISDDSDKIQSGLNSFIKEVNESGDEEGNSYILGMIAMPLLSGYMTLADYMEKQPNYGRVPLRTIIPGNVYYQYYRLMHMGVRHGDFHAGNVMVNPTTNTCKIIDFGRSKSSFFSDPVYRITFPNILSMFDSIVSATHVDGENLL